MLINRQHDWDASGRLSIDKRAAGSDEAETSPPDLSPMPTVFPVVSLLSGCHPPLLLPGCGEGSVAKIIEDVMSMGNRV